MSRRWVGLAAAAVALGLAACTSSGGAPSPSAPVTAPPTSATSPSTPASDATSPSAPASSHPASSTTPKPAPTSAPKTAPSTIAGSSAIPNPIHSTPVPVPVPPTPTRSGNGCTAAQLKLSGVRGGASQGMQFAGVVFTNSSSRACTLRGYPFAQLVRGDRALGRPAQPHPGPVRTIRLAPGAAAQAQLNAVSTCQAPLSDHVQVRAPGTTTLTAVPVQLRGCSVTIDPIEPA